MRFLFILVYLAIIVAYIAGWWKMFEKAGQPGWTAIIPILNIYVWVVKVAKMEWWYFLLGLFCFFFLIPPAIATAEKFGKSSVFGIVALWLFPFVGAVMIGFGEDTYQDTPEAPIF
jgi:hypothetical protein